MIESSNAAGRSPQEALALILGLGFFCSFIQVILSRFLHFAQVIFPPVVTGTAVALIGLTLIRFGMRDMAGGDAAEAVGDFGALKYWVVSIGDSVSRICAAIMLMFGTVAVAGFNILREIDMTNRTLVIVGASLATGLGVTYVPEGLSGFPEQIQTILSSGISVGSLCALILNLVLPKSEEDRMADEPQHAENEAQSLARAE